MAGSDKGGEPSSQSQDFPSNLFHQNNKKFKVSFRRKKGAGGRGADGGAGRRQGDATGGGAGGGYLKVSLWISSSLLLKYWFT